MQLPRILLVLAVSPVQWNHLVFADGRLAHGAQLARRSRLQPLVQARPAEQMAAHADHGVLGRFQADCAFVH